MRPSREDNWPRHIVLVRVPGHHTWLELYLNDAKVVRIGKRRAIVRDLRRVWWRGRTFRGLRVRSIESRSHAQWQASCEF